MKMFIENGTPDFKLYYIYTKLYFEHYILTGFLLSYLVSILSRLVTCFLSDTRAQKALAYILSKQLDSIILCEHRITHVGSLLCDARQFVYGRLSM